MATTTLDVRAQRSEAAILTALDAGHLTTSAMAVATGLHRATVRHVLLRLESGGWIVQDSPRLTGSRGRPERTYRRRTGEA